MEPVIDKTKKMKKPPVSGKINIQEATVISEENTETVTSSDNIKKDEVVKEYAQNLQDQNTVNLDEINKKTSGEKVTIDFMNEDHIKNFTSSQTKKAEENTEKESEHFKGKSTDEIREEIKQAEQDSTKSFTFKDFEEIAGFIIFLIDTGISSGLKWWSKDTSDSAYSLSEKKKNMLTYQLALILTKYQAKFSIEFMFILTILIVYAPAFVLAKNKRKESTSSKSTVKTEYKFNQQAENFENNNEKNFTDLTSKVAENVNEVNTGLKKRGRGQPKKA